MTQSEFSEKALFEIIEKSRQLGFLSEQDVQAQIEHSQNFIDLVPEAEYVVDLGAGGGLPSLVYLQRYQEKELWAVDSMSKRTNFLEAVKSKVESLNNRFHIVNGRAEVVSSKPDLQHKFDVAIARGFSTPQVTAECATRFLKVGGYLAVSGRPENEEERWDNDGLSVLGLKLEEVRGKGNAHAAILYKFSLENPKYPRRAAAMKNTPLW